MRDKLSKSPDPPPLRSDLCAASRVHSWRSKTNRDKLHAVRWVGEMTLLYGVQHRGEASGIPHLVYCSTSPERGAMNLTMIAGDEITSGFLLVWIGIS